MRPAISQSRSALVAELNRELSALQDGRVDEAEFRIWYSATFHELPMRLFMEYLAREYPEDEIEDLVARHVSQRPDLLHALGWWMMSRISGENWSRARISCSIATTRPWGRMQRPWK